MIYTQDTMNHAKLGCILSMLSITEGEYLGDYFMQIKRTIAYVVIGLAILLLQGEYQDRYVYARNANSVRSLDEFITLVDDIDSYLGDGVVQPMFWYYIKHYETPQNGFRYFTYNGVNDINAQLNMLSYTVEVSLDKYEDSKFRYDDVYVSDDAYINFKLNPTNQEYLHCVYPGEIIVKDVNHIELGVIYLYTTKAVESAYDVYSKYDSHEITYYDKQGDYDVHSVYYEDKDLYVYVYMYEDNFSPSFYICTQGENKYENMEFIHEHLEFTHGINKEGI